MSLAWLRALVEYVGSGAVQLTRSGVVSTPIRARGIESSAAWACHDTTLHGVHWGWSVRRLTEWSSIVEGRGSRCSATVTASVSVAQ